MQPRLHIITLAVRDLDTARAFYQQGLGWPLSPASQDTIAFFQLGGVVLALYQRKDLAEDAGVDPAGSGFKGFTLAHNVRDKEEVATVLKHARAAGGTLVKPARDVSWGGRSGYFADPDGNLWEVAWNPHFPFNERGEVVLP